MAKWLGNDFSLQMISSSSQSESRLRYAFEDKYLITRCAVLDRITRSRRRGNRYTPACLPVAQVKFIFAVLCDSPPSVCILKSLKSGTMNSFVIICFIDSCEWMVWCDVCNDRTEFLPLQIYAMAMANIFSHRQWKAWHLLYSLASLAVIEPAPGASVCINSAQVIDLFCWGKKRIFRMTRDSMTTKLSRYKIQNQHFEFGLQLANWIAESWSCFSRIDRPLASGELRLLSMEICIFVALIVYANLIITTIICIPNFEHHLLNRSIVFVLSLRSQAYRGRKKYCSSCLLIQFDLLFVRIGILLSTHFSLLILFHITNEPWINLVNLTITCAPCQMPLFHGVSHCSWCWQQQPHQTGSDSTLVSLTLVYTSIESVHQYRGRKRDFSLCAHLYIPVSPPFFFYFGLGHMLTMHCAHEGMFLPPQYTTHNTAWI